MTNLINFPLDRARKKQIPKVDPMYQPVTAEEAVNELTHHMLTEVIRIYIDNRWSFAELDLIVAEFRDVMMRNAPDNLTRQNVEFMKNQLHPVWAEIVESIRSQRD